jgi:hypothetical protein
VTDVIVILYSSITLFELNMENILKNTDSYETQTLKINLKHKLQENYNRWWKNEIFKDNGMQSPRE